MCLFKLLSVLLVADPLAHRHKLRTQPCEDPFTNQEVLLKGVFHELSTADCALEGGGVRSLLLVLENAGEEEGGALLGEPGMRETYLFLVAMGLRWRTFNLGACRLFGGGHKLSFAFLWGPASDLLLGRKGFDWQGFSVSVFLWLGARSAFLCTSLGLAPFACKGFMVALELFCALPPTALCCDFCRN